MVGCRLSHQTQDRWRKGTYGQLFAEPEFRRVFPVPPNEIGQRLILEKWHARKSAVFQELVQQGPSP